MSALPNQPLGATARHGRVADAFIASYVRELLDDDEVEAPRAMQEQRVDAVAVTAPVAADGVATDATI